MNDDVSAIPTTGCTVLTGNNTISNYSSNIRKDFIQNGGKWYLYRTQSSYNPYDISSYNCIDPTVLSSYEIYKPFLYGLGFVLFVFVLALIIKTVKGFLYGV